MQKNRIKISVLSPNLSDNCLGRAHLLAKILSKRFDVEILGPVFSKGIWGSVKNDPDIKYTVLPSPLKINDTLNKIDGDIIYAIKPMGTSFGYGLLKKFISKKPLILDIDDWESGFYLDYSIWGIIKSCLVFWEINNVFYISILERLSKFANDITVSSSFLQKRFGGIIIPHAKNIGIFDPDLYDRSELRKELKVQGKKVIIFGGTLRRHKGIETLIDAIKILNDREIILLLLGVDFKDSYDIALLKKKVDFMRFIEMQPLEKVPEFLSAADLVVLPQKNSFSTKGQIPAKVFDAMLMEKPIIATDVSDLPIILEGCGIIIEPENKEQLADKIRFIFDNPGLAKSLGKKAREKCIKKYSPSAIENKLFDLFQQYCPEEMIK